MSKFRAAAALCAAVMCFAAAGCGDEIKHNKNTAADGLTTADQDTTDAEDTDTVSTPKTVEEGGKEPAVPVYDEINVSGSKVAYKEFSKRFEAEEGALGQAVKADKREGSSGEGYVTNISSDGDWQINADIETQQYYNITIAVASDGAARNGISVNGVKLSEFTTMGTGAFETCTFKNILLPKGKNSVSLVIEQGGVDVDYVEITASQDIAKLSYSLGTPLLSDQNADGSAKGLYKYLCESFGQTVLLGQYDTVGTSYETDLIYTTTGKYPAIRFGDLMEITGGEETAENCADELAAAKKWHQDGGIVGYMWNWTSPIDKANTDSIYAENCTFDMTRAVTEESVASLKAEDIMALYKEGKVHAETVKLIEDIDTAAAALKELQAENIPVIWRPLQEASNGLYWWGKDEEAYKWTYKLMYDRMTAYHGLHNLIWVWSAQNVKWYVGDNYCDVLSVDVYSDDDSKDAKVNSLLYLQNICNSKPIAMSECGSLPLIQSIADENAKWSYIGQWGANFIVDEKGRLSEEYNTAEDLITIYNNNLTTTRDSLPDMELYEKKAAADEAAAKAEAAKKKAQEQEKNSDSSAAS